MGGRGGGEPPPPPSSGSTTTAAAPPSGKRGRDTEEEVYLDNLHSHKRYLSEMMASSLNGLSVGDSLAAENLMESPARSESISYSYPRDEIASQYSPMSEDLDDCRCYESNTSTAQQPDAMSTPSSPVSPHRFQKACGGFSSPASPYPLPSCSLSAVACSHPRRGSDTEGRFPSSPNDVCHASDLRKAALLRSVQMRAQAPCQPMYESPSDGGQVNIGRADEGEDESLPPCVKPPEDENGCYQQTPENDADYVEDCSSADGQE